jgi:homoserine O-succinyltransferase/O-acetyltransferase
MPLIIDGGRVPNRWAERSTFNSAIPIDRHGKETESLTLALINNMPDPAVEDTELQFFDLLDVASGDIPIYLKLYSLTGLPRTDRGQRHLNSFYYPFDDLWRTRFDGVIITGTEPHRADLRDEPYWALMSEVFDWAERTTNSTILSCLAAHAAVLHCDGIKRHALPDKKFGVFESGKNCEHSLIRETENVLRFPHSRWNEVREQELTAAGYDVLTKSPEAGVDLFVKRKKKSLFVHLQGHPEYGPETLGKEYRRDVKRYLRNERDTYPNLPIGYFDEQSTRALTDFRQSAQCRRTEEIMDSFPEKALQGLESSWHSAAVCLYRNWAAYLLSAREWSAFVPMNTFHRQAHRRQSAVS